MTKQARIAGLAAVLMGATALAACVAPGRQAPYTGPVVAAPNPCTDITASIYFERDSAALTRDAMQVLRGIAAQAEACQFKTVSVYGLSDPVGVPVPEVGVTVAV